MAIRPQAALTITRVPCRGIAIRASEERAVVVVHASNLRPVKRPRAIVYSAEHVLAREPAITYLIVGEGACRTEMEATCAVLGIRDRFGFAGRGDHRQMPDYLNLADIVVMPSDTEGRARV